MRLTDLAFSGRQIVMLTMHGKIIWRVHKH